MYEIENIINYAYFWLMKELQWNLNKYYTYLQIQKGCNELWLMNKGSWIKNRLD